MGAGALVRPMAAFAQQKVHRIGYLANRLDPAAPTPTYTAFVEGMRKFGWVEGLNMEIRIKSSGDQPEQFPSLARELVQENVDVIFSGSLAATRAAKAATARIPIVFGSAENPVERGLVQSLGRPGGNVTGFATIVTELAGKRLQLLKEMLPRSRRFVRLYRASGDLAAQQETIKEYDDAARSEGVALEHVAVSDLKDIEHAFQAAVRHRVDGFHVKSDGWLVRNGRYIAELALKRRIAVMGSDDRLPQAGALCSYGEHFASMYKEAAELVHKILKEGAKPAELPVQIASPQLVINMRTAESLGIRIPKSILVQSFREIK